MMIIENKDPNESSNEDTTTQQHNTNDESSVGSDGPNPSLVAAAAADYDINISNNSATSNNDQCDMTSLEILNKCHLDLFPKKSPVSDDELCLRFVAKLPTLSGEYVQFVGYSGKLNNDPLIITNFRLFFLNHDCTSFINVPLMLIESIEVKEIIFIYINLKIAKTIR